LELFEKLDAFRKPERLSPFLLACEADKRGRQGMADADYPQAKYLLQLFHKATEPKAQALLDAGMSGPELGAALREARRRAISTAMDSAKPPA
jgi:tRNA nucleotidyltransferase (CCA-adding enzyme)